MKNGNFFNPKSKIQNPKSNERLQKVLARAGLGSRRQMEDWIRAKRVKVNQQIAKLGDRVSSHDNIFVNGRKLSQKKLRIPPRQILCYHKPAGEVCTRYDPGGRSTIFKRLPKLIHGRWISIGRLDFNTSGLLLLTTDGELANRLMHPSYEIEREYAVRVLGTVNDVMLKRLKKGVILDGSLARFKRIINAGGEGANHWYHVILSEGRKHEVRRLWNSQKITVSRLIRIRFGVAMLPNNLRAGHHILLDKTVERMLLKQVGLEN